MSLPIVIIYERHWDVVPSLVTHDLLPILAEQGYDTLCVETPSDMESHKIIESAEVRLKNSLEVRETAKELLEKAGVKTKLCAENFLSLHEPMRVHVSSQRSVPILESIVTIPAAEIGIKAFHKAEKLSVQIKGIDLPTRDFTADDLRQEGASVSFYEERRINAFFSNLLTLRKERAGIVFVCGSYHAGNLLAKFKEIGMQKDLLPFFPHSKTFLMDLDDVHGHKHNNADEKRAHEALKGHTYLLSPDNVSPLVKKIVQDVTKKIGESINEAQYKEKVYGGTANTRHLSDVFQAKFKACVRPGSHVDALVEKGTADVQAIEKAMKAIGIDTYSTIIKKREYLVVPNINLPAVAKKICALQTTTPSTL